jgi:hypothetical protein
MRDEFGQNDPRKIWQDQPAEPSTMPLEKIRQKAEELRAKTRRQLLGNVATPLIVVALCAFAFAGKRIPALEPLLLIALAWSLAGLYFVNRGMWSAAMPGDAALSTGLESYRKEIERRRYLIRRTLLWSFGPVILTIGTFIAALAKVAGDQIFPNALPFLTLVVIWIGAYFVLRVREQRGLQREFDELNRIERDNMQ